MLVWQRKEVQKCHLWQAANRSAQTDSFARVTEAALIAEFKSQDSRQLRDPRELTRVLATGGKPLLIVDEKRIDGPGLPFVFFSVVVMPATVALPTLNEIWGVLQLHHRLRRLSGPRLLKDPASDAASLRNVLERALGKAEVLRAGITYKSLRAWRRESRWPGAITEQSKIRLKNPEYAVLQALLTDYVRTLNLSGLAIMVADSSVQNGLDPQLQGLSNNELGAVTSDVDGTDCHLMIFATTPEDATAGPWLRLPDHDAARASVNSGFEQFAKRVRTAPQDGTMIYWSNSPQRWS